MPVDALQLPEWLAAAVVAAAISLLGFSGKFFIDLIRTYRERKHKRFAKLVELSSLLNASSDVFQKQNHIAHQLCFEMQHRLGVNRKQGQTMDAFLSDCFKRMDEEEKETHAVIRGYTHALRDLNQRMLTWLQQDFEFKTGQTGHIALQFARQLNQLETHLYLWLAKYSVWLPAIEHHSLVYLKDEAHHGTGFPMGIETTLLRFVQKRYGRRSLINGES